jgi:hypothetical protein
MRTQAEGRRNQQPPFSKFETFVLVRHHEDGRQTISADKTDFGMAAACYLSPMDAAIDALVGSRSEMEVRSATSINCQMFRNAEGKALVADIRLGWPVIDGKIALRPDNTLGTYSRALYAESPGLSMLEVNDSVLAEADWLHEQAGLFAWRETCKGLRSWPQTRFAKVALDAVRSIQTCRSSDCSQVRQIALFDPEFERWHFVPRPGSYD